MRNVMQKEHKHRMHVESLGLPGKVSRMIVESRDLASDSTCILKAEPGKLDIKRPKLGILFICLQVGSLFKLVIMM